MRIPRAQSDSVYFQLGGYDRLVRVLDGVSGRLMRDSRLKQFFRGHNETSKRRLKQRFIDFVCERAGGPVLYTGADLKTAHEGLEISKADFAAFEEIVRESAEANKFTAKETSALLKVMRRFAKDVVERPTSPSRRA
jgi:hemoglobin